MITNKTIELIEAQKDWEGNTTEVSLGEYDVYLEENQTNRTLHIYEGRQQFYDESQISKGFFIIFDNVDFEGKKIKYDGNDYVVRHQDRFFNEYGDFHHIEVDFK